MRVEIAAVRRDAAMQHDTRESRAAIARAKTFSKDKAVLKR
jgi:hypothetical protein